MQIYPVRLTGEKSFGKRGKKTTIKVQPRKTTPEKQIELSAPKNYEIYMRPYAKGSSLIQEINNSYDKTQSQTSTPQTNKAGEGKDSEDCGLPEEVSKEIDKALGDKAKTPKGKAIKAFFGILYTVFIMIGSIVGTSYGKDKLAEVPDSIKISFNASKDDIEKIADTYNIDSNIIKFVNNIDEESDLYKASELVIPSKYSYLEEAINKKLDTLYKSSNKMDDETLESYRQQINALTAKQEKQEEISEQYTDGNTVYICIKDFNEHPTLNEKYGSTTLSDDYINRLFDIDDKELCKYNTFSKGESKENTGFTVRTGTVIKVPASAINTENIDVSEYME